MSKVGNEIKGRAKGGKARAEKLTGDRRSEIAKEAATIRWAKRADPNIPQSQYSGELKIGNIVVPCAVLSDGTRVLTETDFMSGMGMYRSGALSVRREQDSGGAQVPLYLAFKNLIPYINIHLSDVHELVLKYKTERGSIAHGIKADLIPKICDIWIDAQEDGVLGKRQEQIADNAKLIMRALAHVGIIALVDEATGYQAVRPADALQKYLEMIVRKELAVWAKKFPDEFYENIYKLRGWPWPGMGKNRYSVVAHYTRDLVYERMAPGLLRELEQKTPKDDKGNRENKLHQWLSEDIGDPMLASHLQSVLTLQRLSIANGWGWNKFMNMVDQIMKKKGQSLDLPFTSDLDASV